MCLYCFHKGIFKSLFDHKHIYSLRITKREGQQLLVIQLHNLQLYFPVEIKNQKYHFLIVLFYSVPLSTFSNIHTPTHAHTHTCRWTYQWQFGVHYLGQGHFGMGTARAGDETIDLPINRQLSLPPELQQRLLTV